MISSIIYNIFDKIKNGLLQISNSVAQKMMLPINKEQAENMCKHINNQYHM